MLFAVSMLGLNTQTFCMIATNITWWRCRSSAPYGTFIFNIAISGTNGAEGGELNFRGGSALVPLKFNHAEASCLLENNT